MKRLFKILSIVFIALITFATLTSCDFESLKNDEEINLDIDLNNKIQIKTLYPNSGMTNNTFANSWTTKYFEKITGYKVIYEQSLSDQMELARSIIQAQQEYHMFKLESGTYMAMVKEGNFVDLKPALEKFGQDLLELIPQEAWDAVTLDGKIYAIPEIGFGQMISSGLIWNMRQLNEVGITKIPETISEVNDAFYALRDHFKEINPNYRAFAMSSAQAYIEPLAAAFGLNKDFFEDENGNVKHVMYHPNYIKYMEWIHQLVVDGIISMEWQGYTGANIYQLMASGNLGCGFLPYWNIPNLIESLSTNSEFANKEEAKASIDWTLHVRGDGTHGSEVQTKAKSLYYNSIGYYICVPAHMAEYGAYVIDWCNQRIKDSAFEGYRLGEEGVHYNFVDSSTEGALKVKIGGVDKYVLLTPKYNQDILPTSMYQTGVNPEVAKELWILSEVSYDCWKILVETDYDNIVGNAIAMAPYIAGWSEIDILSRSVVITYEQKMINARNDQKFQEFFDNLKRVWENNWWTETVDQNVQDWYKNK